MVHFWIIQALVWSVLVCKPVALHLLSLSRCARLWRCSASRCCDWGLAYDDSVLMAVRALVVAGSDLSEDLECCVQRIASPV